MRSGRVAALICMAALAGCAAPVGPLPRHIASAATDPLRGAQAAQDARRHGPEIVAFAGVRPGAKVLDLIPGGGYWTRLFAASIGRAGHVYGVWPTEYAKDDPELPGPYATLAAQYPNVSVLEQPAAALASPESVDLVFTSQNYHDYFNRFMGPVDLKRFNRQVYAALRPGGTFLVVDHAAQAGSGARDTETLHRIDPELVKAQVVEAGFLYAGASPLLANPADDRTSSSVDGPMRGRTDQFVLRFRKP